MVERKVKKEEKITCRRVNLNNRTRRGWYYYVRVGKRKGKYFKVKRGLTRDDYIYSYFRGIRAKKKGVVNWRKVEPKRFYRSILRRKPVDKFIKVGESSVNVGELRKLDVAKMRSNYKEMLRPLVKDEALLDVLTLPENIDKFKFRIETNLKIRMADGSVVKLRAFNKSLQDVKSDFLSVLSFGRFNYPLVRKIRREWKIIEDNGELFGKNSGKITEVAIKEINVVLTYFKGRK